jgi:hypothetical protein
MDAERLGQVAYEAILKAAGLTPRPREVPASSLDERSLRERWERARRQLVVARDAGHIPDTEFPYEPLLDVFREGIIHSWETLESDETTAALLSLATAMEGNFGASLLACVLWKQALITRGAFELAQWVSLREAAIIERERERDDTPDAVED